MLQELPALEIGETDCSEVNRKLSDCWDDLSAQFARDFMVPFAVWLQVSRRRRRSRFVSQFCQRRRVTTLDGLLRLQLILGLLSLNRRLRWKRSSTKCFERIKFGQYGNGDPDPAMNNTCGYIWRRFGECYCRQTLMWEVDGEGRIDFSTLLKDWTLPKETWKAV